MHTRMYTRMEAIENRIAALENTLKGHDSNMKEHSAILLEIWKTLAQAQTKMREGFWGQHGKEKEEQSLETSFVLSGGGDGQNHQEEVKPADTLEPHLKDLKLAAERIEMPLELQIQMAQYSAGTLEVPLASSESSGIALLVSPTTGVQVGYNCSAFIGCCKHQVWQAIRASSAVPYYLDDFSDSKLNCWQDDAIVANNPTVFTIREAQLLWPVTKIDCFISIGCGSVPSKVQKDGWKYLDTGQKLIESACSVDRVEEAPSTLLPMLPKVQYLHFNPVDELWDMELDETDPTIWLKLEDATDEYIQKNRQSFENVCERLLLPFQHEEGLRSQLPKRKESNEGASSPTLWWRCNVLLVEDVIYENVDEKVSCLFPTRNLVFRRPVFERVENLVQSEALLKEEQPYNKSIVWTGRKKANSSSKSRKRGSHKRTNDASNHLTVYHGYLASSYHTGIISGFMLISSYMGSVSSSWKMVKAIILRIGASLLPMFLRKCIPLLDIEAVELDPTIAGIARDYFSFAEDKILEVHVDDGIQYVRGIASSAAAETEVHKNKNTYSNTESPSNGNHSISLEDGMRPAEVGVIIINGDSSDPSAGITWPAPEFLDESFLETMKAILSQEGLFIVNLVSWSLTIKDIILLRIKKVFNHLSCLQLNEDVNEVHFALKSKSCIKDDCFL